MRKHFIFITIAALGALVCSCEREKDIDTPGEIGKNTLAFTLKTSGAETRSMDAAPAVQRGAIIPLETTEDGQSFFLEETIASLDDPTFFEPALTRGTPAFTENFLNLSGGTFQALAFPAEPMTGTKEAYATFPRTAYGNERTNNFADFEYKGEFWEYSYDWDPWFNDEKLLFFAKMVVNESTAFTGAELGQNIGVLRNSYEFIYDGNKPKMSFSYRSRLTAEEQQDILFATRTITRAESKKAVPMLFYHALSGVKFATAYDNNSDVKTFIKKIELTGLYGYGKCYVTSTAENGEYADDPDKAIRSSADAISWDLTSSTAANSLSYVYTQTYSQNDVVTYDGSGFSSKGEYPGSFSQAGFKNNLNDGDASMTFWFIPQDMTDQVKLTVTYDIEVDGVKKEYKNTLELGKALQAQASGKNARWEAGQIRTFTLKPDQVDVKIEDEVHGFVKDNVVITNTGNVDAFIRAHIAANWWGVTVDGHDGIALGYEGDEDDVFEPIRYVKPWKMDDSEGAPYYGEFTGLPGDDWVLAKDGYYYYTKAVAPGDPTGTLFDRFEWVTTEHPVPVIWYLSETSGLKKFSRVRLIMDIPVQAIEAKKSGEDFVSYIEGWAEAGVTVVPAE